MATAATRSSAQLSRRRALPRRPIIRSPELAAFEQAAASVGLKVVIDGEPDLLPEGAIP